MEMRKIGSLSVSVVGLGCNNFGGRIDAAATTAVVAAALDAGINYFDTADVYGSSLSEAYLGKALRGHRDEVVLATKFGAPGSSDEGKQRGGADWVRTAVERSLKRLATDRIDHYQMHFPDADTPIEETLGALDDLVRAGKVLEVGCSNFGSTRIHEACDAAERDDFAPFRTVQNRYSVLFREAEEKVVPACLERGLGVIPYFPLESGLLTGKYHRGQELPDGSRLAGMGDDQRARFLADDSLERVERLRAYARDRSHSLLELAISWLCASPCVVSVISGATRPDQVRANAGAAGWELSAEERSEIATIA